MPNYSELIYWLALIYESDLKLNIVKPIIQQWCFAEQRPLAQLFEMSSLEWAARFGLADEDAERAARAHTKLPKQATVVAQWRSQNIEPLIRTDPRYPKRLIHRLPPAKQPLILWARGALNLLNEPCVSVLGSQPVDAATTALLDELMQTLVTERIGLVSGYGRGLDRTAFETMLTVDTGWAISVLPIGLSAFAKSISKLEPALAAEKIVLVSPFTPDTAYQEKLAEARNLLIDHLALALIIPQADDETQTRAKEALSRTLPVFVGMTDTAGNRLLLDQGAYLLTDAGEVVEMVQQSLIDDELIDSDEELPLTNVATASLATTQVSQPGPEESFNLRVEDVEPIDTDEALEILSLGGAVPEILRQRLKKTPKPKN
jgi:DNA processing protein